MEYFRRRIGLLYRLNNARLYLLGESRRIGNRTYFGSCLLAYFILCVIWYSLGRLIANSPDESLFKGFNDYYKGAFLMLAIILWLPVMKCLREKIVNNTLSKIEKLTVGYKGNEYLTASYLRAGGYYIGLCVLGCVIPIVFHLWVYYVIHRGNGLMEPYMWVFWLILFLVVMVCYVAALSDLKLRKSIISASFAGFCGCYYYTYITLLAGDDERIGALIQYPENSFDGYCLTIVVLCVIHILYSIVGYVACNMYKTFRLFYHSSLECRIRYPIENISEAENALKYIREVFLVYSFFSILAYIHLFISAILMDTLNNSLTKVLFSVASICPLCMMIGVSYFHRKLCHDIYVTQLEKSGIEEHVKRCCDGLGSKDELDYYLRIRNEYYREIDISKYADVKYYFIALIPPIITATPNYIGIFKGFLLR